MSELSVLVTDRFTPEALEKIKAELKMPVISTETKPDLNQLKNAYAMLIRSRTVIDKDLLAQAPHLKVIITATSGFNHIQLPESELEKLTVMYTPEANARSAAEHTLFLILSAIKRATDTQRALRDGRWRDGLTLGTELHGRVVGLIGLGRVGSRVAHLVKSFGAEVIAHDPYQKDEVFNKLEIERLGISEVFSQADILSFHVPLNKETRRMVRAETIELMQDGVVLINTSRGQVIDEGALLAALDNKSVSAAALDVFEHEPLSRDSRLRKYSNVIVTPHQGAFTTQAYERASAIAAEKLIEFFKNHRSSDRITKTDTTAPQ